MKTSILVAFLLASGAALAIVPAASATGDPFGPPCPSMGGCCGIEPPGGCCGVTCGPPDVQCPEEHLGSASSSAAAQVALPLPQPGVTTHADCTATVTDTWVCPNGFEPAPVHLTEGPVTVSGQSCVPICRCMPIESPSSVQPCPTYVGGCCTTFAPCCSVVTCPPPVARCPETSVDTTDYVQWLGPSASVATHSNCTAGACLSGAAAMCCGGVGGVYAYCNKLDLCLPPTSMAMALPLPHVGVVQNADCSVTATETYDCPAGFLDGTLYYNAGPAHVAAGYCFVMCACMPMSEPTRIEAPDLGVLR